MERVRGVAEHVNELVDDLTDALVFPLLLTLSNLPEQRVIGCISTYCYRVYFSSSRAAALRFS